MTSKAVKTKSKNQQLANFYNNVGSAWFIAGIITPFFIRNDSAPFATLTNAIIAITFTAISLQISFIYSAK
jgi:hypothetical protein